MVIANISTFSDGLYSHTICSWGVRVSAILKFWTNSLPLKEKIEFMFAEANKDENCLSKG